MSHPARSHAAPPQPTDPEAVRAIVARIPEGFFPLNGLASRLGVPLKALRALLDGSAEPHGLGRYGELVYDASRLTRAEVAARWHTGAPAYPSAAALRQPIIAEQLAARNAALQPRPELLATLTRLAPAGYLPEAEYAASPADAAAVQALLDYKLLTRLDGLVYDPLRLGPQSAARLGEQIRLQPLRERLCVWLAAEPGQTARREEFFNRAGHGKDAEALLAKPGDFVSYTVQSDRLRDTAWVRLANAPAADAVRAAEARLAEIEHQQWETCRQACGDVVRPGARDGQTLHLQVAARSYLPAAAAKRLGLPSRAVDEAARQHVLAAFTDPLGKIRLTASGVEAAAADKAAWETVAAFERLTARDIALVSGLSYSAIRYRLEKAGISRTEPRWGQVRGKWGLPESLREFQAICVPRRQAWLAEILAEKQREEDHRQVEVDRSRSAERRRREELRQKLLTVFPDWNDVPRAGQTLTLHVGPTNSGKTYEALQHLVAAGSGWYLAPLRLLAYEVFETLNRAGTPCNLLTGEESIPVPGARITASTIEMFAPSRAEVCTVIDEAHMLADEQRGWAWTRALMESQAPDLHVIGAPAAGPLVQRLAAEAGLAFQQVDHQRLTPLAVAPHPWSLAGLPPKTILVAFSRAMVLGLKTELERSHHRRVSIIYGDLPPEVRRAQATRFAAGETEICVATDAVGMGLNLPADHVAFFEVQKFDGRLRRTLTPNELRQIGGRAGRFGLSETGLVGALNRNDLDVVRRGFAAPGGGLEFARVAPSGEALALLPGTLSQKLSQWMELRSIPDNWQKLLKPVDVGDAIELAALLSQGDVAALGEAHALQLVRAPSDENTHAYWLQCARAIIRQSPMPLPPPSSAAIRNAQDLQTAETRIRCADVYLWLSQRREFSWAGPEAEAVRAARAATSREVDAALQRRLDTARRCRQCGRPLPFSHRFPICDSCHFERRRYPEDWD